ncbi:acyl-CoA dehydrogenase family protein [Mycolicibacterium phlei]
MRFVIDDDVLGLVESVTDFFERRGDRGAITEASRGSAAADRQRWQALCAMGVPLLRLPEPDGVGAGLLEVAAVAETFGAVLLPEPAVAALVLAPLWANHPAARGLLDGLCTGSRITTLSVFDDVVVSPSGEITGRVRVFDDGISDSVAVLAHDEYTGGSALAVFDMAVLGPQGGGPALDPTRPLTEVTPAGVEPLAILRLCGEDAERMRHEFVILSAAELVGGMQQVLRDTVEFVKTRTQFGRPIGSFQAVKHQLADAYALTEQSRALVQVAALSIVDDPQDIVGSLARWVPRSAITVFETAVHLHGAMGFSWEVDVHLYLRRALVLRTALNRYAAAPTVQAV